MSGSTVNADMGMLTDVYVNGVTTGMASALRNAYSVSDEAIDNQVDIWVTAMRKSPEFMARIEREVMETVAGIDSGPANLTLEAEPLPERAQVACIAFGEVIGAAREMGRLLSARFPWDKRVKKTVRDLDERITRAESLIHIVNELREEAS